MDNALIPSVPAADDGVVGPPLDDRMQLEADTFLLRLSAAASQERQRQAIMSAIAGDDSALRALREARNAVATPPVPGVLTQEIGDGLLLYRREEAAPQPSAAPLLIYLHGGGWTIGSPATCARFCARLCQRFGIAVLAVDYPLAPEHPYPAALDACVAAMGRARRDAAAWGCDPARISVGGDSAGANLAIATALRLAAAGEHWLSALLLYYPVVKAWRDASPSWRHYGEGCALDSELMAAFSLAYAGDEPQHPEISVALADNDLLALLPPTLTVAAGRDILADQGEDFTLRLRHLGVKARRVVFPSAVHLFITVPGQPTAFETAVELGGDFLSSSSTEL